MSRARGNVDVAELPVTVFGARSLTTWGTLGFILAESATMAVAVAAYFYLRRNFEEYPPLGTANPDLLWPTIGLVVLLASLGIARWTDHAARRFDQRSTALSILVSIGFGIAILAIRVLEALGTHTRWDSNAYGSLVWMILGFHTFLVFVDTVESTVMWLVVRRPDVEEKHFVDATDSAFYWYFAALVWVPLYVVLYLVPRWI